MHPNDMQKVMELLKRDSIVKVRSTPSAPDLDALRLESP